MGIDATLFAKQKKVGAYYDREYKLIDFGIGIQDNVKDKRRFYLLEQVSDANKGLSEPELLELLELNVIAAQDNRGYNLLRVLEMRIQVKRFLSRHPGDVYFSLNDTDNVGNCLYAKLTDDPSWTQEDICEDCGLILEDDVKPPDVKEIWKLQSRICPHCGSNIFRMLDSSPPILRDIRYLCEWCGKTTTEHEMSAYTEQQVKQQRLSKRITFAEGLLVGLLFGFLVAGIIWVIANGL